MKRATIALVLAAALLLPVVGCQVYYPTNNSTLYTAMRTEGATSWKDYSKKFEDADAEGKYEILKEYETFRKTFKDFERENEKGEKEQVKARDEWLKAYKSADEKTGALKEPYNGNEGYSTLSSIYGTKGQLQVLWDKEYDVLWDFNGKL